MAVFIAIGCLTRRTAVWSLAFVFLVERLLGAALTGIAQLSPTWESRAIFVGLLDDPPRRLVREGIPAGSAAVFRLLLVSLVALGIANVADAPPPPLRRLRLGISIDEWSRSMSGLDRSDDSAPRPCLAAAGAGAVASIDGPSRADVTSAR